MTVWDLVVGHDDAVTALREACDSGRVAHAWLFAGPPGTGKQHAAVAFAAALNCPDGGDGTCQICRRVLRGVHPDVHLLEPEGDSVLVEEMREVRREAWRSHTEGRVAVFVLQDADRMTEAAANALLKVLEEPADDVVFVLLARSVEAVLPTIASRARPLSFAALPAATLRDSLVAELGVTPLAAARAAAAGHGRVGRARELLTDPAALERRSRTLELAADLLGGRATSALDAAALVVAAADAVSAELKGVHSGELDDMTEVFGTGRPAAAMRRRLEATHRRAARRARFEVLREAVADLIGVFRDVLVIARAKAADLTATPLVHPDRAAETAKLAARVGERTALLACTALEEADRRLVLGAAPLLTLEEAFLAIQDAAAGRPVRIERTQILQGGRV